MSVLDLYGIKTETPPSTEAVIDPSASTDVQSTEQPIVEQPALEDKALVNQQETPDFNEDEIISRLTGGAVSTVADFKSNFPKWQELSSKGEVDIESIKEQAFASPFVKELNELIKSGAEPHKISTFIELSNIGDISMLDNIEALAMKMSIEEGVPIEKARAFVKLDLKSEESFIDQADGDEEKGKQLYERYKHSLDRQAKSAKQFLESNKKDIYTENVTAKNQPSEAQVKFQELHGKWDAGKQVVASHLLTTGVKPIEIKDEKAGIDYSYSVRVPQDYVEKIIGEIPNFAAQNGLSLDANGLESIKQEVIKSYFADNHQSIIESIIRDSFAKALKSEVEKNSNPAPIKGVATNPQPQRENNPHHPLNFYR